MIKSARVAKYPSAASASILGSGLGFAAFLPRLAPDPVAADLQPVPGEKMRAHLLEDDVAQHGRQVRRVALEARDDRARVELAVGDEDRRLRVPAGRVAAIDAVVIGPAGAVPRQGALVELDVVVQLEPDHLAGCVLPGEQVEIVVLEPSAPERRVALLDDRDLAQGIG